MKTITARTDGATTRHAQNVSDFSHHSLGRRRTGATTERGATTSPPTADCKPVSASEASGLGRLDHYLLGSRDVAGNRHRVDDIHVIGDPAFLGSEAMDHARHDDVRLEVGHRGALVVVVAGAHASVDASRNRALQWVEGVLTSDRA